MTESSTSPAARLPLSSEPSTDSFHGTGDYLTSDSLDVAVRCALVLERPLLVRGEPGTGKTRLAEALARSLDAELITWHVKSTTRAQDGLYHYDTVARLYDSRFGDRDVTDIRQYIRMGPLGQAFRAPERVVVLIDEIDKADIEFPNDLLHELDRMRFTVAETGDVVAASQRPVIVITSNAEKELPDAFLRRCVFHFIEFPDRDLMSQIVHVHHPDLNSQLVEKALDAFYRLRDVPTIRKRPSTSELIDWLAMLALDPQASLQSLEKSDLPFLGTLLKKEHDLSVIRPSAQPSIRRRGPLGH